MRLSVSVVADADAVAAVGAQRQHRGDFPLHGAARGTLEVCWCMLVAHHRLSG